MKSRSPRFAASRDAGVPASAIPHPKPIGLGRFQRARPSSFDRSSLPQVLFSSPGYFFWAFKKRALPGPLGIEAQELNVKARTIRIPQRGPEQLVADYVQERFTGKFVDVEVVPASRPPSGFRLDRLDLGVAHDFGGYDKHGERLLVAAIKRELFGVGSRMSRARSERFFADPENFLA